MMALAIGPERDYPSWNWVGPDTAREMEKYFTVSIFGSYDKVPDADVIMIVKDRPPMAFVETARRMASKLIYLPIDFYGGADQIRRDADFLGACDLVLCHCETLMDFFRPYSARVGFVEHHGKYMLPAPAAYKQSGYVLWVGGCQYLPYLMRWLEDHPISCEIKILTNFNDRRARIAARLLAAEIGVPLRFTEGSVNGHEIRIWSEGEQLAMLRACKAAIDIKGTDFNQAHKPPTKAQQFVGSAIPFACNPNSYAARYFRDRGLDLANPRAEDRWFSREYAAESRTFSRALRELTSLETVGRAYKTHIDSL